MSVGCFGESENKENNGGNNMMPDMAKKYCQDDARYG